MLRSGILVEIGQSYGNKQYSLWWTQCRTWKCLYCQLRSVMRAVNYDRFAVKTFFINQSVISSKRIYPTPGQDERLMTNETLIGARKLLKFAEEELLSFQFFMDLWEKTVPFRFLSLLKMPYVDLQHLVFKRTMDKSRLSVSWKSAGCPESCSHRLKRMT